MCYVKNKTCEVNKMASISTGCENLFEKWLNKKLRELNTDESVFGSYIIGILEDEDNPDDKNESLEGILSEILENDIQAVLKEIIDKWEEFNAAKLANEKDTKLVEDVDTKLARLMESKQLATIKQKQYTPEELRIREQILAQYSSLPADEDDEEVEDIEDSALSKNTNAQDVVQAQKEHREQARLDSQNKKLKDKEDREKQKQQREEKKEKRKTVKGERRR